jgi:SAM-dependent methyltransferase
VLIGIDASRALTAQRTGAETYSLHLLRALIGLGTAHRFRLYVNQPLPPDAAPLTVGERDRHLRATLDRLEALAARDAEAIRAVFEEGWREHVQRCAVEGASWETLKPRYVKPFPVVRYRDDLVAPMSPTFVDDLLSCLVTFAFESYLDGADTVYEFGCGTGRYLYLAWQLFPSKTLVGLDWTDASLELLGLMARAGAPVRGIPFNLLAPDAKVRLAPNSAVTTISALEQLGGRAGPFLYYLVEAGPSVVVHLEPIAEFYDPRDLLDSLALAYHRRRGYLSGFWPALETLEGQGRIEILEARRTHFGDPFHDGMSLVVWRPRR